MEVRQVPGSRLAAQVTRVLLDGRSPGWETERKRVVAQYTRAKGKREEVADEYGRTGFWRVVRGKPEFVLSPGTDGGSHLIWAYFGYSRERGALQSGLLKESACNRDIRPERVEKYAQAMRKGEWRTLFSDPITVTSDGQVLNGQHRIAAASCVDWSKVENDPEFLILIGVEPDEALYADGSSRTAIDEKTIAVKLVKGKAA